VIAQLLLAFLADAVFKSAASKDRTVSAEISRYFEERGLGQRRVPRPAPAPLR
jgi:hypothetical protein